MHRRFFVQYARNAAECRHDASQKRHGAGKQAPLAPSYNAARHLIRTSPYRTIGDIFRIKYSTYCASRQYGTTPPWALVVAHEGPAQATISPKSSKAAPRARDGQDPRLFQAVNSSQVVVQGRTRLCDPGRPMSASSACPITPSIDGVFSLGNVNANRASIVRRVPPTVLVTHPSRDGA